MRQTTLFGRRSSPVQLGVWYPADAPPPGNGTALITKGGGINHAGRLSSARLSALPAEHPDFVDVDSNWAILRNKKNNGYNKVRPMGMFGRGA